MGIFNKLWKFLKRPPVYSTLFVAGAAVVAWKLYHSLPAKVSLTAFLTALSSNTVSEIVDHGDTLVFKSGSGIWAKADASTLNKMDLISQCTTHGIEYISKTRDKLMLPLAAELASVSALVSSLLYTQWKQATPKKSLQHKTNIRFRDIAGNFEAKQALMEIIEFFKQPQRFAAVGASLPRGVLFYGPSGTGKTMLAKATACEAEINFIECTGSEFFEMFVGVGVKRVRDIFKQARDNSPCILFIDEIECLALKRGCISDQSNTDHHSTLNQLLTEMDGFRATNNIVVLGATNKHFLLTRRFCGPDVLIGRSMLDSRIEKPVFRSCDLLSPLGDEATEAVLTLITNEAVEASGAELTSIVNEAAFEVIRNGKEKVEDEELKSALGKFMASRRKFGKGVKCR